MKSPKEISDDILKSLNKENAPERILLELYLEKIIKQHRDDAVNQHIESLDK